jgi:hypothetical protein
VGGDSAALERGPAVARQGTTAATVGGGENMSAIDDVSRVVSDALQSMSDSTVSEQDVSGDAHRYDVQIGDENVTVNVGGAVSQ